MALRIFLARGIIPSPGRGTPPGGTPSRTLAHEIDPRFEMTHRSRRTRLAGCNAMRTTLGAVASLVEARIVPGT
jgi:hypothetical protein